MDYETMLNNEQAEPVKAIGENQIRAAAERLQKYKSAKADLENRIIENEQFFKLRHWEQKATRDKVSPTAWLWNVILSKHADLMDGYPEANIRPKERDDKHEATMLSSIVPVVFESNGFYKTFSKCAWYKLVKGTGVYGVFWDSGKQQGRGDISVEKVDILNLFWEPGVMNIQQSKEMFHLALVDKDKLEQIYPQLKDKTIAKSIDIAEYIYDDNIDTSDKVVVVDWYYKKYQNGRTVLHYCKFVDNIVLYATENETEVPTEPAFDPQSGEPLINPATGEQLMQAVGQSIAERGWYDHGQFPFVFDPLFVIEGSPCGYSFIDICKSTQEDIDLLNHAIVKNALMGSRPRFFVRDDGAINEEEFADYGKDFVHVAGSVSEDNIVPITVPGLPSNCVTVLNNKIEELKETSGNRDVNNGSASSGVTAASAIAALQESAGKTSRDSLASTYEAFKEVTYQVIELIRQFYDTERQFRITGTDGKEDFVDYSNANIKPQQQMQFGIDFGYRVPQFDIEVSAQKATAYSKMSQNELSLQFYQAGIFNPQNTDQALACLEMMDFNHKQDVIDRVQQNGTLFQQVQQLLNISMSLASRYEPQLAQQIAMMFANQGGEQMMQQAAMNTQMQEQNSDGT
ncbi:MAG: hypothetical protein NC110_05800, partial [Ruminococcus sp.]|nr:hypothetical protein [Ruminococcus sp.]